MEKLKLSHKMKKILLLLLIVMGTVTTVNAQ